MEAEAQANDAVQRAIIPLFEVKGQEHEVRQVGWLHVAAAAIDALKSQPVEVRMEVMGMRPVRLGNGHIVCWEER